MTPEQFDALAQLMRLRQSASREALRLVLVEGLTHAAAAERAGSIRTDVTRLVSSAKRAIELARTIASGATDAPFDWGKFLMPEGSRLIKEEKYGESALVDLREVAIKALQAIETVLIDAYHRRTKDCECSKDLNEAWTPVDNQIFTVLSPAQSQLYKILCQSDAPGQCRNI